jgi:hypothetical protein
MVDVALSMSDEDTAGKRYRSEDILGLKEEVARVFYLYERLHKRPKSREMSHP